MNKQMWKQFWKDAVRIISTEFSTERLVSHTLKQIDQYNRFVNAVVSINPNLISEAKNYLSLQSGVRKGLTGLPILIKDSLGTKNWITTSGATLLATHTALEDADIVKSLRDAGAIIIGKTNTPEFCNDVQTFNKVYGITRNPYDLDLTCGGSSGGSAVAVALGMVPLAIGTDMAGSLRIPAAYCGVYALRPTVDRISTKGHIPHVPEKSEHPYISSVFAVGAIAQEVELLQRFMEAACKKFKRKELPKNTKLKFAMTTTFPFVKLDYRITDALKSLHTTLNKGNTSCEYVDPKLNYDGLKTAFKTLTKPIGASAAQLATKSKLKLSVNEKEFKEAIKIQQEARTLVEKLFEKYDAWLLPVSPLLPYKHNQSHDPIEYQTYNDSGEIQKTVLPYWKQISLSTPISTTGHPIVTVPIGMVNNLPIGIQVVGRYQDDETLLAICKVLEDILVEPISEPLMKPSDSLQSKL